MNLLWKKVSELAVNKYLRLLGAEITGMFRSATVQLLNSDAVAALTASATLTAAQLLTGLLSANAATAAGVTYTLPSGTDFENALRAAFGKKDLKVGDGIEFVLLNVSTVAAEDATIAAGAGWTLSGSMVVASNDAATSISVGRFRARRTAANTYTLYRVG